MIPVRNRKILLLDGHSKAAATSVLALPPESTVHVAAMEEDCLSFRSRRVAVRHRQPAETEQLRAWLQELDAAEHYDLVVASTETSLLAVKTRHLDAELRRRCVIPDEAALDIALDKRRTLELAAQLDIHVPQGNLVESLDTAVEPTAWPVVVKPLHSKVETATHTLSLQPRICANANAWRKALQEFLPFSSVLVQEYFQGFGVGVEVLFNRGEPCWIFAHQRIHEWPITGGASTYRRAIRAPAALCDASLAMLRHLHWHGVAMVEFKVARGGDYRLMEINPRLWGSLPLAIAAGVNFPTGLLRLATGESPGPQPAYPLRYSRDVVKDLHWFEDSWRERHNPLRLKPLRVRDFAGWLRPLVGLEAWDLFRWRETEMWRASLQPAIAGVQARMRRRRALAKSRANWRALGPMWRDGRIRSVLVLCYGNICRSPLAAILLRRALPELEIVSSGFHGRAGRSSPDDWAAQVAATLGDDLCSHHSQVVTAADLVRADLVVVMDARNWHTLAARFPEAAHKTVLLGPASAAGGPPEIADPYGEAAAEMRNIALQLAGCCAALAQQRQPAPLRRIPDGSA